jgi:hypothetical protein
LSAGVAEWRGRVANEEMGTLLELYKDVINQLEQLLPAQPFSAEWKLLHPDESIAKSEKEITWWQAGKRLQSWLRRTKHREAAVIGQVVPIVFMLIYVVLGLRVIFQ